MKADAFKKLIKEAVREVLKEELISILSENAKTKSTPTGKEGRGTITKFEPYKPTVSKPVPTGDPIADLLNETKAEMSGDEYRTAYSGISDMVSAPGLGENMYRPTMMEESFARPEPGLDISQFDFVKNAAAVFNASQQKDKERFGG